VRDPWSDWHGRRDLRDRTIGHAQKHETRAIDALDEAIARRQACRDRAAGTAAADHANASDGVGHSHDTGHDFTINDRADAADRVIARASGVRYAGSGAN
jgi:hypothetical protein